MSRCRIAIELGPRYLRGVAVSCSGNSVRVVASIVKLRPELDSEAVADWIRAALDEAGLPVGRCLLAVSRDDVVIKRLMLETPSKGELPAMVDLAMRDELHLDGGEAIIDFLSDHVAGAESNLLAAALPESSLQRGKKRMALAKRPIGCMSLRLLGAAQLVADPHGGRIACIDVSGDGAEFTLLEGRDVRVARAAMLPGGSDEETAEAAIREARRTWMSWRAEVGAAVIDQVILMGPDGLTSRILGSMPDITDTPVTVLSSHARVDQANHDVGRLWSLIGLLIAHNTSRPLIDFTAPRKASHRFERRRQVGLAAAGVLLVLFGTIWTWGNSRVQSMQQQLDSINLQRSKLEPKWLRYHRDRYRLAHLDLWSSVQPDWVHHLAVAVDRLQPAGALVLDEVSAVLDYKGIDAPRRGKVSDWKPTSSARLVLEAEAESREVGEAFRQHWVEDTAWHVATSGADTEDGNRLPFGVTIRLHSPDESKSQPVDAEAKP